MEFTDDKAARAEALHRTAWFASKADNLDEPGVIVVTVRHANGERVMTVRLACTVALG